jgi:hypothetical protein
MHGRFNYSAQETSATFIAGETYTFSLWAQGDSVYDQDNGVFLYIFDGNVPFSEANALKSQLFTSSIHQRLAPPTETEAQSRANWTQLSISYTVPLDGSAIGHPVGVGFFLRHDSAVDDASLSVTPEPSTMILVSMAGLSVLGWRRRS